jgi:hypothetical protein
MAAPGGSAMAGIADFGDDSPRRHGGALVTFNWPYSWRMWSGHLYSIHHVGATARRDGAASTSIAPPCLRVSVVTTIFADGCGLPG